MMTASFPIRVIDYRIPECFDAVSIGAFLRAHGYSQSIISHLKRTYLPQAGLSIDGARVFTNRLLKSGELLRITLVETASSEQISETKLPLDILYEDEDLMVINKPADMPVHPSQGNHTNTLANALVWHAHHALKQNHFVFRVINRLDRDTTGLLIVAKNMLAAAVLGEAIRARTIKRSYLALCCGHVEAPCTIDAPIARAADSTIERCVDFVRGECAVTKLTPLAFNPNTQLSLVRLRLETGRTHQIRVHMKYLGHPLTGDFLYHPDKTYICRQALHSAELSFQHPVTGVQLHFTAPLPEDMARLL